MVQVRGFSGGGDGGYVGRLGGGEVEGDDVEGGLGGGCTSGSGGWDEEVVDYGDAGGPRCAEDFVFFAVEEAEFEAWGAGLGGEGSEDGDGFLSLSSVCLRYAMKR